MKTCPFCAEVVQDAAIICKHCGRDLFSQPGDEKPQALPTDPEISKKKTNMVGRNLLLVLAISLGLVVFANIMNEIEISLSRNSLLEMDLSQFVAKYDRMTDIQKVDFVEKSARKWVDWSGIVKEVREDGTILVGISGTHESTVNLEGVPKEKAINIVKGQRVHFGGRIDDVTGDKSLSIYLRNVELKP